MGNALFVVWRESLEAVLIIGILHSFLTRKPTPNTSQAVRAMWWGVAGGILLSLALGAATMLVQDQLQGRALDWFQAGIMIVSAGLMTQMVMWMNKHGRHLKRELESNMGQALTTSGLWGAALVAMFAVAREGAETVVYLYGLTLGSQMSALALVGVTLAGIALALATSYTVARGIRFLSYPTFFKITSYALLFSAAGLLIGGASRLIEMDVLPAGPDPVWNSSWLLDSGEGAGKFIASLTGYRASPSLALVVVYAAYWIVGLGILNRSLWMPQPSKS